MFLYFYIFVSWHAATGWAEGSGSAQSKNMDTDMNVRIEESWRRCLQPEFDSPYFAELAEFVRHEYASCTVYPPARRIFHAFDS